MIYQRVPLNGSKLFLTLVHLGGPRVFFCLYSSSFFPQGVSVVNRPPFPIIDLVLPTDPSFFPVFFFDKIKTFFHFVVSPAASFVPGCPPLRFEPPSVSPFLTGCRLFISSQSPFFLRLDLLP